MKILWLTIDRSMRVMQHFDMLQNIMSEKGVVKIIKRKTDNIMAAPYSIQTMVTKERKCLPFDFDWINFDIIFRV